MSDTTPDETQDDATTFEGLYRLSFQDGKLSLELGAQADKAVEMDYERAMVLITEKIRAHVDKLWTGAVQTLAMKNGYEEAGLDWNEDESGY